MYALELWREASPEVSETDALCVRGIALMICFLKTFYSHHHFFINNVIFHDCILSDSKKLSESCLKTNLFPVNGYNTVL